MDKDDKGEGGGKRPTVVRVRVHKEGVLRGPEPLFRTIEDRLARLGVSVLFESIENGMLVFFEREKDVYRLLEVLLLVRRVLGYVPGGGQEVVPWTFTVDDAPPEITEKILKALERSLVEYAGSPERVVFSGRSLEVKFPATMHFANMLRKFDSLSDNDD
ncbi:MAG: hypothetical protein ACTSU5_17845 [Promethearchaeota archaeon]